MKKRDWKRILLVVFSVVAIVVACTPNSVSVYREGELVGKCSYLTLVEGVKGAVSLPAAVLVSCVNLTLASLCVALKKKKLLGAIKITSMLGAGLAVLPILIHEANVMLLPNVVVPIALMAVFFDVFAMTNRKEAKEGQPTGKTL